MTFPALKGVEAVREKVAGNRVEQARQIQVIGVNLVTKLYASCSPSFLSSHDTFNLEEANATEDLLRATWAPFALASLSHSRLTAFDMEP